MNKEDLLKLLDLSGPETTPAPGESLAITSTTPGLTAAPVSPTALALDAWGLRRGRDVLQECERLQATGLGEHAIADFFGCGFEPEPQLLPGCADLRRHEFITQLLQTPEYHALHTTTLLNAPASTLAATVFAEQFAALQKEECIPSQEGSSPKREGSTRKPTLHPDMSTLRAVGRALLEASKDVEECQEAVAALGLGPGSPGSNDAQVIARLYRKVRSSPTLRTICALAGRYRRLAMSRQRRKLLHGSDDLVGIVLDGELGRVLPSELARLAVPEFEDDTLRRLLERQLLCREYRSTEPVGQGPLLVVLDESGSMCGEKIHTAKALALALAWLARQQRRWLALISYSGDSGEKLLPLPPGRWDEAALLEWLESFIGEGSTLDVPVRELPRYYQQLHAPVGRTDVICITDAVCHIPGELQAQFNSWKQQVQARLIALVIGSRPGDLAHISDEVHLVGTLDASEAGVERVLSL